jgi:pheromone shutdown-related protein TraB
MTENSIEKIERQNVDYIKLADKEIYLVGTAHVSQQSVDLVEEIIREVKPDTVAIELCDKRYESLRDPDRWKNTDIFAVIKQGHGYVLFAQLLLAGFQKKLGAQLQVKPGAEMLKAALIAEEIGSQIVFADRNVRVTLKRTWSALGLLSMSKVILAFLSGFFSNEKIEEDELERLKRSDVLEEVMKDFSKALPEVRRDLIDERDQYLAQKIRTASGKKIVAVVGAGHCPGIKEYIHQDRDLSVLEIIPEPSMIRRIIPWIIPSLVVAMIVFGFYNSESIGFEMLSSWVLINAFFAGLGALIALAHPLSILTAAIVAPYTAINPVLASGWFSGLMEAYIRKPRVVDLETIGEDISSVKGFYHNRVLRVFVVMFVTNLFGSIGTLVSLGKIFKLT